MTATNKWVDPVAGADGPGQSVELEIATDLAKRALYILPILAIAGVVGWGSKGAIAVGISTFIVIVNFIVAGRITTWAARISAVALMAATMFGLVIRLGIIFVVLIALRHVSWVARTPLAISLIVLHLVLLVWETRYISGTLAYPGLKPKLSTQISIPPVSKKD